MFKCLLFYTQVMFERFELKFKGSEHKFKTFELKFKPFEHNFLIGKDTTLSC